MLVDFFALSEVHLFLGRVRDELEAVKAFGPHVAVDAVWLFADVPIEDLRVNLSEVHPGLQDTARWLLHGAAIHKIVVLVGGSLGFY